MNLARILEERLKKGDGTAEIAKRIGVEPSKVEETIKKTLTIRAAEKYIKRLRSNDKRGARSSSSVRKKTDKKNENVALEKKGETNMKNPNIVALTEEIAALKENLNSIELEHKSLVQKRTKIRGELKDIKRALEVILETINSKESRIISIIEDINVSIPYMGKEANIIPEE